MKNQYFGDIYDYVKYSLLRQVSCLGQVPTVVCWMLTENDEQRDGHHVNYLRDPESWRKFDPPVFDCLRTAIFERKMREVSVIEESGLLPKSSFYSDVLSDVLSERNRYFRGLIKFARGSELVFFDPDNGLEIKSVKCGSKRSSRYLFWHEVAQFFSAGHSLLVYQHIPPKPRAPFVRNLANGLARSTGSNLVYVFRTQRVAFFLVPQVAHIKRFNEAASKVRTTWDDVLLVEQHDVN